MKNSFNKTILIVSFVSVVASCASHDINQFSCDTLQGASIRADTAVDDAQKDQSENIDNIT